MSFRLRLVWAGDNVAARSICIMKSATCSNSWTIGTLVLVAGLWLSGCTPSQESGSAAAKPAGAQPATGVSSAAVAPPAPRMAAVRIKAGPSESFKDADGNTWLPEQGFTDGDTVARPEIEIANTKTPAIYRSERYSMSAFSYSVPNGKYTVKLHFAETYEGITAPGERVFSFIVQGHEYKNFDVWVKAGGPLRAYVETVPVVVTDGKLQITFTPNVENPEINGIEILPEP
jgi:hypothetical protein